jgi:hypothetical protein
MAAALESILTAAPLRFQVGGQQLSITQRWLYFREYFGPAPKNTLGKPVVGPPEQPFAELQAVDRLKRQGWTAGWFYQQREFISAWEPHREAQLSPTAQELLARIDSRAAGNVSCWDVLAMEPEFRCIHMVRAGSPLELPPSKQRWLEAAIADGVPCSAFEIWRWFGGALAGRLLRLTFYSLDRCDGWVDVQKGRMTYSADSLKGIVEHYRDWGAQTEADLLWLVFMRNSQGMTWCEIDEHDATP